jgi:hypothetical protein
MAAQRRGGARREASRDRGLAGSRRAHEQDDAVQRQRYLAELRARREVQDRLREQPVL